MYQKSQIFVIAILLMTALFINCGLFEPDSQPASLTIQVQSADNRLSKPAASLDKMQCVVKRNSSTVSDQTVYPDGGYFECTVNDLDPGSGYAVYLFGYDAGSVVVSGSETGITLSKGQNKEVSISWQRSPYLNVSKSSLSLSSSSNSQSSFDIESNVSWTVSDDASWLSVSPGSGSGDGTVTVTATSANTSTSSRSATVTVSGDGVSSKSITVNQQGSEFETGTVTDIDGNTYKTIKIGDQWWMTENLIVTHYRNGDVIPNVTSDSEWADLSSGAYCVYDNDESNAETYGYLYNWYAVDDSRNIAPEGWRVPTDEDWKQLEMALGMSQSEADDTGWRGTNEGSKLAGNASLWYDGDLENNSAFGASGFSALPGGYRSNHNGNYSNMGYNGYFWSSSEDDSSNAWYRHLYCSYSDVGRNYANGRIGFALRCDLLLEIFQFTKNFTREYKYTVGESLKNETLELITLIYRANSKTDKRDTLQTAREKIEVIRLFVRLMKDLKQISLKKFVHVNKKVEIVSRQLTGWHKSVR